MRVKSVILATLVLTSLGFSVIPTMAQINQQPQIPAVELTQELKRAVSTSDQWLYRGIEGEGRDFNNMREVLVKKIDNVIMLFQKENFHAGYKKLENDIAPKLNICETARV